MKISENLENTCHSNQWTVRSTEKKTEDGRRTHDHNYGRTTKAGEGNVLFMLWVISKVRGQIILNAYICVLALAACWEWHQCLLILFSMSNKCFWRCRAEGGAWPGYYLMSWQWQGKRHRRTKRNMVLQPNALLAFYSQKCISALQFMRPLEFCNISYRTQLNSVASAEGHKASWNEVCALTTAIILLSILQIDSGSASCRGIAR